MKQLRARKSRFFSDGEIKKLRSDGAKFSLPESGGDSGEDSNVRPQTTYPQITHAHLEVPSSLFRISAYHKKSYQCSLKSGWMGAGWMGAGWMGAG